MGLLLCNIFRTKYDSSSYGMVYASEPVPIRKEKLHFFNSESDFSLFADINSDVLEQADDMKDDINISLDSIF